MAAVADEEVREAVCNGVSLGWQVASLYNSLRRPDGSPGPGRDAQPDLRSPGSDRADGVLHGRESLPSQLPLRVAQVRATLTRIGPIFQGIDPPQTGELDDLPGADTTTMSKIVTQFHDGILVALNAADYRIGKGYNVGRLLANLCYQADNAGVLMGRLLHLEKRIQGIRSVLPPHVAKAVSDSISNWTDWIAEPRDSNGVEVTADKAVEMIKKVLPDQVRRWRGLLTGEKDPTDLLSMASYVNAATMLMNRYMHIGREYFLRWWPYLAGVFAVVGGIITLILVYGSGASSAVAAIATGLAAVGITGKGVSAILSRAADAVEASVRQTELDGAMGAAATISPSGIPAQPRPVPGI